MTKSERSLWIVAGSLVLMIGVLFAHPGHPPIAPPTVRFTAVKPVTFELFRGQRIFLDGVVNERATPIMCDTGAGMTVIDKKFAEELHLAKGTEIQVQTATDPVPGELVGGVSLSAGALQLTNLTVLVMDLSRTSRGIGRPVQAILGREAFMGSVVTIDFPNRTIDFVERSTFQPLPNAARVPLADSGPTKRMRISVAGLPTIDADVDLGNGGALILSNAYWTRQPRISSLKHAASQVGGAAGMTSARRVTVPYVEVADRRYEDVPVILNDEPQTRPREGANVGIGIFRPFVASFDFAGDVIYLSGPKVVRGFPRERAGVGTELDGDRLRVKYVSPEGPGAAAGLKAGDEIVAVNGDKIRADYYSKGYEWTYGEAGEMVELQRADGSKVTVRLADYY